MKPGPVPTNMEALMAELPPLESEDRATEIIAAARPRHLEYALRGTIHSFEIQDSFLDIGRSHAAAHEQIVAEHGQKLSEMHADSAERIQSMLADMAKRGVPLPPGMMDDAVRHAELADMPPELLGTETFLTEIYGDSDMKLAKDEMELERERPNYELAVEVRKKRDRLGLPGKVGAWALGLLMTAGLTYGAAHIYDAGPKATERDKQAELPFDIGAGITVGLAGTLATAIAAEPSSRRLAQHRAKSRLRRS